MTLPLILMFVDVVVVAAVGILHHRCHHFHHFSFDQFLVTFTQTHANMFEFATLIKTIDDFELKLNAKCMKYGEWREGERTENSV